MGKWKIIRTINHKGPNKLFEVKSSKGQLGALKEIENFEGLNTKKFEKEIKVFQRTRHQHIVNVLESNINGAPEKMKPFYVMEFLTGGSMEIKKERMFNVHKGLFSQKWTLGKVILPIVAALEYAHHRNICHGDLKPSNIIFTTPEQNHIKVVGWQIGKEKLQITMPKNEMQATYYSSPEQYCFSDVVDQRTDIFSLGIILYEMMTGKLPAVFDNSGQLGYIPVPSENHPTISHRLDNAILKMIAYDSKNRYQTITEVKEALTPIFRSL